MKRTLLQIALAFTALAVSSNAATMAVNNLVQGPIRTEMGNEYAGDILYASGANVLMNGGVVTMGYFAAGVAPTTIAELQAALSSYTLVTSATPGDMTAIFGVDVAGYASQTAGTAVGAAPITGAPLLGRSIYSIVADNADLAMATEYALVLIGSFVSDDPVPNEYFSNPAGGTVVIGTSSTIALSPDPALPTGNGTYRTLQTVAVVPEPSAALLGAIGALGLLRRRRI